MFKFIVLAVALTCVVAKPDPGQLLYTAPSLYSAPLAGAPLAAAPLASAYYSAPLTYSASNYRPYTYASPYAYSAYNTYNYRAPIAAYSSYPAAAYIH